MLKTVRGQLLSAFIVIALIAGSTGLWGLYLHQKATQLSALASEMDAVLLKAMEMSLLEGDVLRYDGIDPEFFARGTSERLTAHRATTYEIDSLLSQMRAGGQLELISRGGDNWEATFRNVQKNLRAYRDSFATLVDYQLQRGFKDAGVIGEMRHKIHALEDDHPGVEVKHVLMLRRHEKDYIIHKDSQYLGKLEGLAGELIAGLESRGDAERHARVIDLLAGYRADFRRMVELEARLGLNNRGGLMAETQRQARATAQGLTRLGDSIHASVAEQNRSYHTLLIVVGIGSVALAVFLGFLLSRGITRPIQRLTDSVREAVANNFARATPVRKDAYAAEVNQLAADFERMLDEIRKRLAEVRQQARTMDTQNKVLKALNHQLTESEQRLSRINRVKDKMLSIVSHDLRSPLNSMQGYLELLETQVGMFTPRQTEEFANAMRRKVTGVVQLLDNLLRWSLFQSGELEFNPQPVDVREIAARNIDLYEDIAREKGVALKMIGQGPATARADEVMLDFVLRNLLSNAIKFSPQGAEATISCGGSATQVEVAVIDQGVGMTEEQLQRLLDRGEHFTTTGTNQEKGTGLGMTLVMDFLEKMNGQMRIESAPGQGTSVYFSLPVAVPDEALA